MFSRKKVKKYFLKHPKELESLRKEVRQFSNNMDRLINDEDIPDFSDFLARNKEIAPYFQSANKERGLISKRLKFIIPSTTAFLLALFIIFTPVGHAFANDIFKTFAQWFGNGVNIHHGTNDMPSDVPTTVPEFFDTIEDVQTELSLRIAYNKQAALCEKIEVQKDDTLIKISSTYSHNSQSIIVTQTIFDGDTEWDSNIQFDNGQSIDQTLNDNTRFIGYVQDNSGYAVAFIDNMKIEIYSENIDYDCFVSFVKGMSLN